MAELMKGNRWLERKDAVDRKGNPIVKYPVYVEIKVDEIRCHVLIDPGVANEGVSVKFLSYAGKPLANMKQFARQFLHLACETGYTEFDCGFEVNGNFNDSCRWVRSTKKLPTDLEGAETRFILFDLPESNERYKQRRAFIKSVASVGHLDVSEMVICHNAADVESRFVTARAAGNEGIMVKQMDHLYQRGKRTDGWLKFKPSEDTDGIIVKINEAVSLDGVPLGRAGSVDVVCADNSSASPSGIEHALGFEMWQHPERFIGQTCEFKYMEKDRQGGYRHPSFHRIRES